MSETNPNKPRRGALPGSRFYPRAATTAVSSTAHVNPLRRRRSGWRFLSYRDIHVYVARNSGISTDERFSPSRSLPVPPSLFLSARHDDHGQPEKWPCNMPAAPRINSNLCTPDIQSDHVLPTCFRLYLYKVRYDQLLLFVGGTIIFRMSRH